MVAVGAEAKRSEWGFVSVAWDAAGTPGDSPLSISSPGMGESFTGTARSPGLAGPRRDLGLQRRAGTEMEAT